jgi:hypothetical protein
MPETLPRKDSTVSGYRLVRFLLLILRMRLIRMLKEFGLSEKYCIKGRLTELGRSGW